MPKIDLEYQALVEKFVTFQSVSTDKEYINQIAATAEWLKKLFEEQGFVVELVRGYGNPLVIASIIVDPNKETCLIYGHYDVQPAKKDDGWQNDPFSLVEDEEKLVARGVADNKGQIAIHMQTVFQLLKEHKLKYNVTFLIEGEEESGSDGITRFLSEEGKKLSADFLLISDGSFDKDSPALEKSFRGAVNFEIHLNTGHTDAHSGMYGGVLPNASVEMSKLLQKMTDENDLVQIPGFYEGVEPIDPEIIDANMELNFSDQRIKEILGCRKVFLQPNVDYYTQLGLYPSLEVTGVSSGYTNEGFSNIIPHSAIAKINVRTAPNQDPEKIFAAVKNWIVNIVPDYVEVGVIQTVSAPGVMLDTKNQYADRAKTIIEDVYGRPPVEVFQGATLPLLAALVKLGIPQVIVPLANDDNNAHAVGENFSKKYIEQGMDFSRKFLSEE